MTFPSPSETQKFDDINYKVQEEGDEKLEEQQMIFNQYKEEVDMGANQMLSKKGLNTSQQQAIKDQYKAFLTGRRPPKPPKSLLKSSKIPAQHVTPNRFQKYIVTTKNP